MSKNITNNGKKGGWLKGKPHYDKNGNSVGGIKAIVTDAGNKPVELEGGEVIINKEASKKHWKELSRINQSAGNGVPIEPPYGADEDPSEYKDGGNIIEFNPNHVPSKYIISYALNIKTKYPKVWDLGGNIFGNTAFENLERVSKRGHWLDSEEWMYIKWRSYVARHIHDFRIEGVIAMLKWTDKVEKGWSYMKDLIEQEIAKKYPKKEGWKHKMKQGGELSKGIKTEFEHKKTIEKIAKQDLTPKQGATLIAKDHLKESKKYYSELEKMESKFNKGGITGDVFSIKDPEQFKQIITLYNKFSEKFNVDNYFLNDNSVVFLRKVKFTATELKEMSIYMSDLSKNKNFTIISDKQADISNGYFKFFLKERVKYAQGGLIAPNGKKSNLTPEQYKLVRTPAFKKWFGDWENDPESASKVVDENGEPLIMYSGSPYKFTIFKTDEIESDRDDRDFKSRFWFIVDKSLAEIYSRKKTGQIENVYEVFLNIRNPKHDFNLYVDDNEDGSVEFSNKKIWVAIATSSNQIKLADGTNTTFDSNNPDIRYKEGGLMENEPPADFENVLWDELADRYKEGGNVVTYKQKYNKKYGYDLDESHSLEEIAKDTNISLKVLQQIYNKGVGAYNTNPESVRPNVKSSEQWAMARVYSAVMGGKTAKIDHVELKMKNGGNINMKAEDLKIGDIGTLKGRTDRKVKIVRISAKIVTFIDILDNKEKGIYTEDFIKKYTPNVLQAKQPNVKATQKSYDNLIGFTLVRDDQGDIEKYKINKIGYSLAEYYLEISFIDAPSTIRPFYLREKEIEDLSNGKFFMLDKISFFIEELYYPKTKASVSDDKPVLKSNTAIGYNLVRNGIEYKINKVTYTGSTNLFEINAEFKNENYNFLFNPEQWNALLKGDKALNFYIKERYNPVSLTGLPQIGYTIIDNVGEEYKIEKVEFSNNIVYVTLKDKLGIFQEQAYKSETWFDLLAGKKVSEGEYIKELQKTSIAAVVKGPKTTKKPFDASLNYEELLQNFLSEEAVSFMKVEDSKMEIDIVSNFEMMLDNWK